jgi:hypothetical protein
MTDRTPHESLPVPTGAGVRRQYFRLVVGTVTAWYADHSTPNPLGYLPDPAVRIINGDKFALYASIPSGAYWHCGNTAELQAAREFARVQALLCEFGLAHARQRFLDYGCTSLARIVALEREQAAQHTTLHSTMSALWDSAPAVHIGWGPDFSADGRALFAGHEDSARYEVPQMKELVAKAKQIVQSERSSSGWLWLWGK